ncbi:MAG: hypothetical protein KJ970_13085 [Candidatus Eisenbacteria bacterium]|uniref:Polymer-forming cytoskeletal protein n=1 Tax=Eiseniibacteriota bacterium TaxID=2212470 RepID=A0A948S104_UNCEI|nr:hypothetical protein [Candidatus Eisenbacteria bacterium]MBU2691849.1 hypothetical protein [Candidatus Eisenbacteria bacterium]
MSTHNVSLRALMMNISASVLAVALGLLAGFVAHYLLVSPAHAQESTDAKDVGRYSVEYDSDDMTRVWVRLPSGEDSLAMMLKGDLTADLDSLIALIGHEELRKDLKKRVTVRSSQNNRTTGDIIRMGENVVIEEGDRIDGSVVCIGGSIRVRGVVEGDVVAVGGDVVLLATAVVDGDCVSVGGGVDSDPDAVVGGKEISIGAFSPIFTPQIFRTKFHQGPPPGLRSILIMALFIGAFLFGWLFQAISSRRMENIRITVEQKFFPSLFLGIITIPGSVLLFILLLITIIGIPAAILLPFVMAILTFMGFCAVLWSIGRTLLFSMRKKESGFEMSYALGLALLFVIVEIVNIWQYVNIPGAAALGFLLVALKLVITSVGMGAVLLSRIGSRPNPGPAAAYPPAASRGLPQGMSQIETHMETQPFQPPNKPPDPQQPGANPTING